MSIELKAEMVQAAQQLITERAQLIYNALAAAKVPNDDLTVVAMGSMLQSRLVTHQIFSMLDAEAAAPKVSL